MLEPAVERGDGAGFDVDKFQTHANLGLNDANGGEGFDTIAFASQGDASARFHRKRLTGADKTAAEREIGGNALRADAGFQVEDDGICGERITDSIAAVAEANFVRRAIGGSVVHGDKVAHCELDGKSESRPGERALPSLEQECQREPQNTGIAWDKRAKESTESAGGRRRRDEEEILVGTTKRKTLEGAAGRGMLI